MRQCTRAALRSPPAAVSAGPSPPSVSLACHVKPHRNGGGAANLVFGATSNAYALAIGKSGFYLSLYWLWDRTTYNIWRIRFRGLDVETRFHGHGIRGTA